MQPALEAGEQDAERALARLAMLDIDPGAISEKLLADGITGIHPFFGRVAGSLKEKRKVLLERHAARKGGTRAARTT